MCCEYIEDACVYCRNTTGMHACGGCIGDACVYCRSVAGMHVCCEYMKNACVYCRSAAGMHVCGGFIEYAYVLQENARLKGLLPTLEAGPEVFHPKDTPYLHSAFLGSKKTMLGNNLFNQPSLHIEYLCISFELVA